MIIQNASYPHGWCPLLCSHILRLFAYRLLGTFPLGFFSAMVRFSHLWLGLLASTTAVSGQGLHQLFVAAGKTFWGTATDTNLFNDGIYMALVNNTSEFGLIVPENSLKWDATEDKQKSFTFTNADKVLALAKANGQMFRCHTLTWHSQLPTFVANGTWTPSTLTAVIQTHIANVVGHYKGQCYSWDVVNEALNDNGTFRSSVFFTTLGTDFIPISFKAAALADPAAKLYYNGESSVRVWPSRVRS
jgi:endo-1,4-beta-xylanase